MLTKALFHPSSVIPAQAGIHILHSAHGAAWIPAFAGMTMKIV